ncbi:MAG TPA: hypothetical protein VLJ76_12020 [Gaiellaceae bacterium]|nr:hypothetical protein [Gaiellaceae bacterium]
MKQAVFAAALLLGLGLGAHAGPARHGFQPLWLAAVSANEFWLGGKYTVLHTTDGGRRFHHLPPPPVAGDVNFASSRDGFAFGWRTPLFATHDGGKTWHRIDLRSVLAFAAAGGRAYAVTGRCSSDGSCREIRFERSPVSRDAWVSVPMPFAPAAPNFDLAARGSDVWLFGGQPLGRYRLKNLLARSIDGGRTFAVAMAPCYADLAAELEPTSARVVWAFCPTGMMGMAWRSTDGGSKFKPLRIARCCVNSTQLAPASDTSAVVSRVDLGLLRTVNGGVTWKRTHVPRGVASWYSIEFADARVGFGLAQIGTGPAFTLLRTADAGASWHVVSIR